MSNKQDTEKLSAGSVRYADMPKKQWYMSSTHADWYYHKPRTSPTDKINLNFLDATLDPPLRLLALGLNSLNYPTLPSCSGHYKHPDELNLTYNNLVEDAGKIRKEGLEIIDVETGKKSVYRDRAWHLPWDRGTFIKNASGRAGKPEGYLGFKVGSQDAYRVGSVLQNATNVIPGCRYEVKRCPEGFVFELRVYTGKQKSQDAAWQDLGDSVMLGLTK